MTTQQLPALNAFFNLVATLCLTFGYLAIRKKKQETHKKWMLAAFVFSTAFLISYLVYHYFHGSRPFGGEGIFKTIYLIILIPHIILAAVMLPLILRTFYLAWRKEFVRHRRWARWTLPIWLYVSVTGVLIYLMLYQWFPPPAL